MLHHFTMSQSGWSTRVCMRRMGRSAGSASVGEIMSGGLSIVRNVLAGTRFNACQRQPTPTFARTTRDGCFRQAPHGCRCHKSIAAPIPLAVSDLLSFCTTLSAAAQGHPWAYQYPFNFFPTGRGCRHAKHEVYLFSFITLVSCSPLSW